MNGEEYTERKLNDQQTKTGKEYKYQTYRQTQENWIQNDTGTGNRNQESQEIIQDRNRKKTLKTNSPGVTERCRLNTLGNKTFYMGFLELRRD